MSPSPAAATAATLHTVRDPPPLVKPAARVGVVLESIRFPEPALFVQIKALFFASYRDIAGTDEMSVELPYGASVADLVGRLRSLGSTWQTLPSEPAIAVNLTYAPLATELADGDEVAFIPPVSGG